MDNKKIQDLLNNSKSSSAFNYKKFLIIINEKKYLIFAVTIIFTLLWILFYNNIIKWSPKYTVSVVIRFEDTRRGKNIGGVADFATLGSESKVALLKTNSIIGELVDSLKLNFVLSYPAINRFSLIKNLYLPSKPKYGTYIIKKDKNNNFIIIWRFNKNNSNFEKLIKPEFTKLDIDSIFYISFNNIIAEFYYNAFKTFDKISFKYIPRVKSIRHIKSKLQTKLDRSKTILTVEYTDDHPREAAIILNTLSNIFLDRLLEYKRVETSSLLKLLKKQLEAAELKLHRSEDELRKFREKNPYVVLSGEQNVILDEIVGVENSISEIEKKQEKLKNLFSKIDEASNFESKVLIYSELLSFLSANGDVGFSVIAKEFQDLLTERENLLKQYSSQHPFVIDIQQRIEGLENKINNRVREYQTELESNLKNLRTNLHLKNSQLRNLPSKELKLAELKRNNEINEQILSNIRIKFNEAKVADASIVPDAYLIDEALPPSEMPKFFYTLFKYVGGFLLGIVIGIFLSIGLEFAFPTIRESSEIEEKLHIPVLSNIPIIGTESTIPDENNLVRKVDPKLITSDYSPTMEGESFRILRTKLVLDRLKDNNSIIITSLNPGEGKSLIAANLSITFAQQKFPTLLIDGDIRRGVLHNTFACKRKPGLSELLMFRKPIDENVLNSVIQKTHVPNLYLLTYGTPIPNPSELLGSQQMRELIRLAKNKFGMVVLDCAPFNFTPDAIILNSIVHNILIVTRYGKTSLSRLSQKLEEFKNVKNDIVGIVINGSKDVRSKDYYYSYYQY